MFVYLSYSLILLTTMNFKSFALPDDEGCVDIKDCPIALKHIRNIRRNPDSLRYLDIAHCGFKGLEPFVNCSNLPDITDNFQNSTECIPLQDCPPAVSLIKKGMFNVRGVNVLHLIHCGLDKQQPLVFCQKIIQTVN